MTHQDRQVLVGACVNHFRDKKHVFHKFLEGVRAYFEHHPTLLTGDPPAVHSVRARVKDPEHLREKLLRKWDDTDPVTPDNLFRRVTDLAGIRLLHLHSGQFPTIHRAIQEAIDDREWCLHEAPCAYSWDPESSAFFTDLGITPHIKDSYYTSVHYVIRGRPDAPAACEIQVRTLFEEAWGEIDHSVNYPTKTHSRSCERNLKVLARLVSTAVRLSDSVFEANEE